MTGWPEFDLEQFREMHRERGEQIRWWKHSRCPCRSTANGTSDMNCPECHGTGNIYTEQTGIETYKALVRGVSENKQFASAGLLVMGDVQITTLPDELPLGEQDLILLPGRAIRLSQSMARSLHEFDRVNFWIHQIDEIRDQNTIYAPGSYTAQSTVDDYRILWNPGQPQPEPGAYYALTYHHNPLYVVLPDLGTARRLVTGGALPQRVNGRLRQPVGTTR